MERTTLAQRRSARRASSLAWLYTTRPISDGRSLPSRRTPGFEALEERSLLSATALGAEYQVNTTVTQDQRTIAIGSNPQSTQVTIAWVSVSEDGGGEGVYAQRYDLDGAKVGTPFLVNVTKSGNQGAPAVAMDAFGNFVIVWQSATGDGSGQGIYGRRYGYDATPLATEFRVNSTVTGDQLAPAIAMDDAGNFVVAFHSASRDASGMAVIARRFNAAGTAQGNDFQVNQLVAGDQQSAAIAMSATGQFTIAWQSAGQDGDGGTIVARRYSSAGASLGNEFVVNQFTVGNQTAPSIAANADGSFVVAWQSTGQDGSGETIVARRYSAAGAALAAEFIANQVTSGAQANPSVTSATDSGFVIAWQSALQDGNSDAVVARQYTASGVAADNEFVVNTFVTGAQNNPAVGMEANGDFLVAWQSPGQEAGGGTTLGAFARRYSAVNDAPVMKQISNQITDVGGLIAFTAQSTDQDLAIDSLTYSLAAGAPAGATINPSTGAFSWSTVGVAPGRYFATVQVRDVAGLVDEKVVALTVFAPGERTALDDYVNTLDGAYTWDIRGRTKFDGYTKYDVLLTSGNWRTLADVNKPLWQHWMAVYVPDVILVNKAMLFIDGGNSSTNPPASNDIAAVAGPLAAEVGAVFIDLVNVPSQPLLFAGETVARSEDSIIAYSWKKYLETGDPTWPVNLAMTRAAVRAMDAVEDFMESPVGGNITIDSFVVSGGSKRGWTTWLSAVVDPRVSEIVPIVSDLLNMQTSFAHHYAYYNGTFSSAVQDYVNQGVLDPNKFGTDGINTLLSIVDPFTYKERLTLPAYMLNASGDEFFVPDSWQFYYDQLPGPKAIRYAANSSHGITNQQYYLETLAVFSTFASGGSLPEYSFHQLADGTIELTAAGNVTNAKLWKATNTTKRDFRWPVVGAAYTSTEVLDQGGGVFRANVPTPPQGWTAYYIEVTITNDLGLDVVVSSGIYIKGPPTNVQPDLQTINDVTVIEGTPLVFPLTATNPEVGQTLTYSMAGAPPQMSINPTTGLITGNWNDQVSGPISVIVTVKDNGTPNMPDRDTFLITVLNAAPTALLSGPSAGLPGQSLSFTLLATDPSSVDQAAGFAFQIDWDGDGNVDQIVSGLSGTTVSHAYASPGVYTARVTAMDKDGGVSTPAMLTVSLNQSPPIDPMNQLPLTMVEGSSLLLAAIGWIDPENDPLTYAWDLNADGQYDDATGAITTVTWSSLLAIGLADNGVYQVRLRVDDGHGGVTFSAPIALTITNAPPTADAGGPYAINEGAGLSLLAIASDPAGANDPLTYSWDLNGDDVYGDAVGATPTLSWAQLVSLGLNNGPATFNVRVRVTDDDGGSTDSAVSIVTINNVAPVAAIFGPTTALRGEVKTFTFTASDISEVDALGQFIFTVNWGDGSPVQIVAGYSGVQVTHGFNAAGPITLSVTVTDGSGGVSAPATYGVLVDAYRLRANVDNPLLTDLVWGGTGGADDVTFEQVSASTIRIHEQLLYGTAVNNSVDINSINGRVIAYGNPGNDRLSAAGMSTKVTLDGGAGNNTLYGGNGGDLLIGGSNGGEGQQGNNVIIAGNGDNVIYGNDVLARKKSSGGDNLIVGGSGNDLIYGNFGQNLITANNPNGDGGEGGQNLIVAGGGSDTVYASQIVDGAEGGHGSILIAGSTTLNQTALLSVLSEWTSTHTTAQKLANIQGLGTPDRLNGGNFLKLGETVFDDGAVDDLFSDTNGKDNWLFYAFAQDSVARKKPTEFVSNTN